MMLSKEEKYIIKRVWKAKVQSIPFYLCRIFPINKMKIVFCCIEGSAGYSCNPKYITEEFIRRNASFNKKDRWELVWLVNDIDKIFPNEVKVIKNTLWNRAFHLSTAAIWVDNSRKQLETRKRNNQIYVQTWHAKIGFKPTCLDRGKSFSKMAFLVSKHDSEMIDYVLSNSQWYENTLKTGMMYEGNVLRAGSPRCDALLDISDEKKKLVRESLNLPGHAKIVIYTPTFRGGSESTKRSVSSGEIQLNFKQLIDALEKRFGGQWYLLLRLHPQLTVRNIEYQMTDNEMTHRIIDVSKQDDLYNILPGVDAFITDYSSAAFDAAVARVPVFLFVDDLSDYMDERGKLLWNLDNLPFPYAIDNAQLVKKIIEFDHIKYDEKLSSFFRNVELLEDGKAAMRVVDFLEQLKR